MKLQTTKLLNVAQAKAALAQTAELYFLKNPDGTYRMARRRARPVCLMGPAGIGKTEIVRQVAEEQGLAFLSYSLTHHTRQSILGLPQITQRRFQTQTIWVTEYTVSEIIAELYRVMAETGKREGILFLDEFNCASETLRPIMLQLLQSKTFGPHAIPEGWMLVLAGNPREYNHSAAELDAVTADRLRMIWLHPDYESWREYMISRDLHPVILSFLDDRKRCFYSFERGRDGTGLVTARGWEDLSVMLHRMEQYRFPVTLSFIAQFIQSASIARSFFAYYQQYSALIASGAVDALFHDASEERLNRLLDGLSFSQCWALTSIVLLRLESLCQDPNCPELERRVILERIIMFYATYFFGAPQLEFFLNGITNSDPCAQVIAGYNCKPYAQAAKAVFLQPKLPSSVSMKALLQAG